MAEGRRGRYRLVERLAIGGMAEVYLAVDTQRPRGDSLIVVKRILPHLAADPDFVEMFAREARLATSVVHPNVVRVFGHGIVAGHPIITMEYVPGSTLRQLVDVARERSTNLPFPVVVGLLVQACAAVHAAHEVVPPGAARRGMIHRDVSPQNLMVNDAGQVKLLDFGIATEGNEATRPGLLKGKLNYMPPEVIRQERVDRRADLFALGVVGWELLAGRKPFARDSDHDTMNAIVSGDVDHLRDVRPDVPEELGAILHRALAVDPEARQDSAHALRDELLAFIAANGLRVGPPALAEAVRGLVGERHEARAAAISAALGTEALPALETVLDVGLDDGETVDLDLDDDEGQAPAEGTPSGVGARPGEDAAEPPPEAGRAPVFPPKRAATTLSPRSAPPVKTGPPVGAILAVVAALALGVGWWMTRKAAEAPLQIVLAPVRQTDVLQTAMDPLRRHLEQRMGRSIALTVAASYTAAADSVAAGTADVAVLPNATARSLAARRSDLPEVARQTLGGTASSDGYLLVRRGEIGSTAELKGTTICHPDTLSNTGYQLPRAWLRAQGLDPDVDLSPRISGNHDQVLRDLLSGLCDSGGTYSNLFTTAEPRGIPVSKLQVLAVTGSSPHDVVVGKASLSPQDVRRWRHAFTTYPGSPSQTPVMGFAPP